MTRRISAKITNEEMKQLDEVCKWLGMTRADYVRMCTFGETEYHRKKMLKAGRNEHYVYNR